MSSLIERQSIFIYEGARIQAIAVDAPIIPEEWHLRESAFQDQFFEIIERQMGENRYTSPEEAHDSWVQAYIDMGWRYGDERSVEEKTHPDMVSFYLLEQREQDKDAVFLALCEIARLWIREESEYKIGEE